jgi:hypothetical protein
MLTPTNALGSTASCFQSIQQYIARTDDARPRPETKADLETIQNAQDCYLYLMSMADQPRAAWEAKFFQLDAILQLNGTLFVGAREHFIATALAALMTHIRLNCV